jgi:hypothetical protein
MSDQITLPPVSMADLDSVAVLVAAVGWPHRRADIAALIKLGHGRLARAGDGRTLGVGLWWPFCDTAARLGLVMVSPDSQGPRHRPPADGAAAGRRRPSLGHAAGDVGRPTAL